MTSQPPKGQKDKLTCYVPVDVMAEIRSESLRQERPLSWLVQHAWKLSREQILTYPTSKRVVPQPGKARDA